MATDPSLDETDGAPEDSRADPALARTPGPPRPPRPGKRSKGSGRIPIPLPQNRAEVEAVDPLSMTSAANDAAPSVDIDVAERDDVAFPSPPRHSSGSWEVPAGTSSVSDESFAHDVDFEDDRAPNAPVTPWHRVPSLEPDPALETPHHASFDAARDPSDSEPEPTLVGKVPENLLELSGARDENTRTFTAPRELLELARRKREDLERRRSIALDAREHDHTGATREEHGIDTARAPAAPRGPRLEEESLAAPSVPIDSVLPLRAEGDPAPPVRRTISDHQMEAAALPSRRGSDSRRPAPSGPEIEIDPGSDLSPSVERALDFVPRDVNVASVALPSGLRKSTSTFKWLLTIGLFVIVGIVITRWRDVVALFH